MADRFLGFDTSTYPGDDAMRVWKDSSPYGFAGYYLKAPCHGNTSWSGKRAHLASLGWGFAPLYVGHQAQGNCSGTPLTAELGSANGTDAIAKFAAEGFPVNSVLFLDVEHMDTIPQAMLDYISAWFRQLLPSEFVPSIYCHVKNAAALRAFVESFYPADQLAPLYWVAGGSGFNAATSGPADSGATFASVWQGKLDTTEIHGGISIDIDVNVAGAADPSAVYVAPADD